MQKIAKDKGITLIALVITIIVLLILAGISISTLTGQNGVITRAIEAKEKTDEQGFREFVALERMSYELGVKEKNLNAKQELYEHLKSRDYIITDIEGNVINDSSQLEGVLEIVVKYKEWTENIVLAKNPYEVSNETELAQVLSDIRANNIPNKPITAIDSFNVNNNVEFDNIEFGLRENITLNFNACLNVKGNSKIIGTDKNSSIIKRGDTYSGSVILGEEVDSINLSNVTLDGNAKWTGMEDEILKRGKTCLNESAMADGPFFSVGYGTKYCQLTMENTIVKNCSTKQTGGNLYWGRPGRYTITNCEFRDNNGGDKNNIGSAGTIWITSAASVNFKDCVFSGNSSYGNTYQNGGGAIRIQHGFVTINNCTFENNGAFGGNYGGAIYFVSGELYINDSNFTNNYANVGACIRVNNAYTRVRNTKFDKNKGNVGVILGDPGPESGSDFIDCQFTGNESSAANEGGLIWAPNSSRYDSCLFSGNHNKDMRYLTQANFAPAIIIKGNMDIENNISSDGSDSKNTNIYIGNKFQSIKVAGALTKTKAIHVEVDSSIINTTVFAISYNGYVLTENDLEAFICDTPGYALRLNTTDNVIEVYKE